MLEPVQIVDADADEAAWLAARAEGVTATEVHKLAQGGASARERILSDKVSGSKFRGNQHTARGKRREPIIAEWIERKFGITPNRWLLAHPEHPQYLATPDGFGHVTVQTGLTVPVGSEIKSHDHGWTPPASGIPAEHADQCQWGMFVTGADAWLYVWEVMDADGFPPIEPDYLWVIRDDDRIAQLRAAADSFIAWREAGAPKVDPDIDPELDAAIARNVVAKAELADTDKFIRDYIASNPSAATGLKVSGTVGQLTYVVSERISKSIDLDAWEAADPEGFAAHQKLREEADRIREEADRIEGEALLAHTKTTVTTGTRLTIAAHKTEAKP